MYAARPGARERLVRQARQKSAARWPTAGVLTLPTHLHRAVRALVLVLVLPVQEGLDFLERIRTQQRNFFYRLPRRLWLELTGARCSTVVKV